jgi:sugar phosphate isomerase/epimerase
MKPAFSTVALPDWTLPRIAERAEEWGFLGVELRTFGNGSSRIACDPTLTAPEKTRRLFVRAGVQIVSLATSIRYDAPMSVFQHVLDNRLSVRETNAAVDLAVELECPLVRVFGFEIEAHETRKRAMARIVDRLRQATDHCERSGVRLMVENGGSFLRSSELAEIIDRVASPLLCAAYNLPAGMRAHENPAQAANVLGDLLACVKVRDFKGRVPCALGEGDFPIRDGIEALARAGFDGWIVYEYDRLWFPDAPEPDEVLARSARNLFDWIIASQHRHRTDVKDHDAAGVAPGMAHS